MQTAAPKLNQTSHLIEVNKYASITKLVGVYSKVLKFINILKNEVRKLPLPLNINYYTQAWEKIFKKEQTIYFAEILKHLECTTVGRLRNIPPIIKQLNLAIDNRGLIVVQGRIEKPEKSCYKQPVLLEKNSELTRLIIVGTGTYTLRHLYPTLFLGTYLPKVPTYLLNVMYIYS